MTKWYGKRNKQGEPMLFHRAPGANELNIPEGDNPEDYEKLIPEEDKEMPAIPTDNWNGFIGKLLGGSFAGLVRTIVGFCVFAWVIVTNVEKISDKLNKIDAMEHDVKQTVVALDSIRQTNADYKRTIRPMVYKDHVVLMRHFPKEPEYQPSAWVEDGNGGGGNGN